MTPQSHACRIILRMSNFARGGDIGRLGAFVGSDDFLDNLVGAGAEATARDPVVLQRLLAKDWRIWEAWAAASCATEAQTAEKDLLQLTPSQSNICGV
jgi:hypothetical protein